MSWIVTYPLFINTNLVNDIPYYSHEKRHDRNFNTMKTIQKQIIQNYEIDQGNTDFLVKTS